LYYNQKNIKGDILYKLVKEKKLYEQVVDQIKRLIDEEKLKSNDILPTIEQLSKDIGVSKSTVREALVVLEAIGYIHCVRGKGAIINDVKALNLTEDPRIMLEKYKKNLHHVQEYNIIFEPAIAKLAAQKADEADVKRLEQNLKETEKVKDERNNTEKIEALSLEFHRIISEMTKNPYILNIFLLTEQIEKENRKIAMHSQSRPDGSYEEHKEIFLAIKERDGEKAYGVMYRHLLKVKEYFDKFI
jgi:GntR family transcriptional repressor for pyruvate dehydrogenase complex